MPRFLRRANPAAVILVVISLCVCPAPLPAQDVHPLTVDEMRQMIGTMSDLAIRRHVNDQKVDFELTPDLENEFKARSGTDDLFKISQGTLELMRVKRAVPKGGFEIACKPVDCEVFLENARIGATTQGRFKKTDVTPAKIFVTVKAPGYKDQLAGIEVVANITTPYEFTLERNAPAPPPAPKPADTPPKTAGPATTPIPAAPVTSGGTSASGATPVSPSSTPPANAISSDAGPVQLLNRIVEALGGLASIKNFKGYTGTGMLTLQTAKGSDTAQLKEWILYPKSIRWELKKANVPWNMASADESWSDGDAKLKGSDWIQELEKNLQPFVAMHLAALLPRLQERDVTPSLGPAAGGQTVLIADTPDDKYTITVDSATLLPRRIERERKTGLSATKIQMQYGRYEAQGRLMVPMTMTLLYPSQAGYGVEIDFVKVDQTSVPKESDFKKSGLSRFNPFGK